MESNMNNTIEYTHEVDETLEQYTYTNPSAHTTFPVMGQAGTMHYANNMDHTSPMNDNTPIDHVSSMAPFSPVFHIINPEDTPGAKFTSTMDNASSPMHNSTATNHASTTGFFSPAAHATATEYAPAINHTPRIDQTSSPMHHSARMNNTFAMSHSSPFVPASAHEYATAMNHSSPLAHFSPVAHYSPMAHFSPVAHSSPMVLAPGIKYANLMSRTAPIDYSLPAVHPTTMEHATYMDHRPQINYISAMGPNSPMVHQYLLDYPRGMQNTTPMGFTHMNPVAPMGSTNIMGYPPAINHTYPMDMPSPMGHDSPMAYTTAMTPNVDMGHVAQMDSAVAMEHTTPVGHMAFAGPPAPMTDASSINDAGSDNDGGQTYVVDTFGFAGQMDDAGSAVAVGSGPGLTSVGDPMEDPDLLRDAGLVGAAAPNNVAVEATTAARRPAPAPSRPADDPNTRACFGCGRRRGAASFRDVGILSALVTARVPEAFFSDDEWPGAVPARGYSRCHPCRVKRALDAWGEYSRAVKDRNETAVRKSVKSALFAEKQKEDKARVKAYIAAGLGQDDHLVEGGGSDYDPLTRLRISEEEKEKRLTQGRCIFLGPLCKNKTQQALYCPEHQEMWLEYLEEEKLERAHQQAQKFWYDTRITDAAADAAAGVGPPAALRPAIPVPAAPQPIPRMDPETLIASAIKADHQPRPTHQERRKAATKARQTKKDAESEEWKAKQEAFRTTLKEPLVKPGAGLCDYRKWSCPVLPMPGKKTCELHLEWVEEDRAQRRRWKEEKRREDAAAAAAKREEEEGDGEERG